MLINKALTNTCFFLNAETQSWLMKRYDSIKTSLVPPDCDFGFHITDQPFYCSVCSDDSSIEVELYLRSEVGVFEDCPDLGIKIFTNNEKAVVTTNTGRIGGNGADTITTFFKFAAALNEYIAERGLTAEFSNIDLKTEGVSVLLKNDELLFERVSGVNRPAMACIIPYCGIQMVRPYADEICRGMMLKEISFKSKVLLAERGDTEMMEYLAMAHLRGSDGVKVDPEESAYWFSKLAELGNTSGQFNLGLYYAKGYGVPRDFAKAAYWMQKAADGGDADAPFLVEKYTKAVEALKKINSSDAQAQADLATILMSLASSLEQAGSGDDYALAFDLAAKSAAQNNGDGIWILALAYEHGRGVNKDVNKAIELYHKGAELGHAPSQHSLACYYFRGDVLEANHEKAFELCIKSAEQGYGLAMADIGKCYQFGTHVECDMKQALVWYEKALEAIEDPELEAQVAIFKMLEADGRFNDTTAED